MAPDATMTEEDLVNGQALPTGADLTIGQDFYGDEIDDNDSRPRNQDDPISVAVGSPGYMANHVVAECFETFEGGATTEPEEFDRYYFPPQEDGYTGAAPVLIDILQADTPEEVNQERIDKHVEFKTRWCAERGVRYALLTDLEDLMLPPDALAARIRGADVTPAPTPAAAPAEPEAAQETPQPRRKRGAQHPRGDA